MTIFNKLAGQWPLPLTRDLEAANYLEASGPYLEFDSLNEKPFDVVSPRALSPKGTSWTQRLFSRTPAAINERRRELLAGRDSNSSGSRTSVDLESHASTDASTLLDEIEPREKRPSSKFDARFISDLVIGLADGLTVPFALTAGLSAMGTTRIVILAGLAELMAGVISMGLGGYLGARSEECVWIARSIYCNHVNKNYRDSYRQTFVETREMVSTSTTDIADTVRSVFDPYNLPTNLVDDLTFHLTKSPNLAQFLMQFHHNLPEQEASRAITCALTIALGYFLGGFMPLLPYFFVVKEEVMLALWWSLGVMAVSLFAFGYGKTCFVSGWRGGENVWKGTKGGMQMMLVGGVAAGCAMGFVRLFNSFAV